ncbi:MAG: hypothetical protein NVSMB32_15290 [Actinomycetota bacterium]
MQALPELSPEFSRIEGYFVELLDKLERIATVMERFDNVMNPTLGLAEQALQQEAAHLPEGVAFPSVFLQQVQ